MPTWIALLRGINVGGNHLLPMKSLATLVEAIGGSAVRTYIQSGNVVFVSAVKKRETLAAALAAAIEAAHGFTPRVLLLTAEELSAAASANPFPDAVAAPKSLHLWFLDAAPAAATLDAIEALRKPNESYVLSGRVFYLHAPDGIGQSKLAERVERHLGVPATARNWNTVAKLVEMSQ